MNLPDASRPTYGADQFWASPPALAGFVLYLWRRRFPASDRPIRQPTLPDGCLDILSVDGGPPYLMGPETACAHHLLPGGSDVLGIRLRPGTAGRLFHGAVPALRDAGMLMADLDSPSPARAFLRRTGTLPTLFQPLLDALAPHVGRAGPDDGVSDGITWLARHPNASVDALSSRMGWSAREVRRRFSRGAGLGPKTMQRFLRFQRALWLAGGAVVARSGMRLAMLALEAGYADQAHMTREFRALAGSTPARVLAGPFDSTLDCLFAPGTWHHTVAR